MRIRRRVLEFTIRNNGGYLSQACSSADIFASLYCKIMKLEDVLNYTPKPFPGVPSNDNKEYFTGSYFNGRKAPNLDRFYLSPSQYSLVLYASLIEVGRMASDALDHFNEDGSTLEMIGAEHSPGVGDVMAGSLGQAISQVGGIAQYRKLQREAGRCVLFMSDGELQSGQAMEAFQAIGSYHLDNILIYIDCNGYQCDGPVETVMNIEPLAARLSAFGCNVLEISGHDIDALIHAGSFDALVSGKPQVVICRTCPFYDMEVLKTRAPKFHYVRFKNDSEKQLLINELNRISDTTFLDSSTSISPAEPCVGYQMESRVFAKSLVNFASSHPEILVLSCDLTSSTEIDLFKDSFPDRFFSMGIAEQNAISWAAGLAKDGKYRPFFSTFATFITRRAYDQVAISVAYSNLPVCLFGFLPGVTTPGGATHQALEDIALMRILPNMSVMEVGDAADIESVLDIINTHISGPCYVRMLRGAVPRLFDTPMEFNKARHLQKGEDILLFTSGICTEEALRALAAMKKHASFVSISHFHISTFKPFTDSLVFNTLDRPWKGIVTMENHTIIGGLGTVISEAITRMSCTCSLTMLGIPDEFMHGASRNYLMKKYHIDAISLINTFERILDQSFGITEEDLTACRVEPVHSNAKAEAL